MDSPPCRDTEVMLWQYSILVDNSPSAALTFPDTLNRPSQFCIDGINIFVSSEAVRGGHENIFLLYVFQAQREFLSSSSLCFHLNKWLVFTYPVSIVVAYEQNAQLSLAFFTLVKYTAVCFVVRLCKDGTSTSCTRVTNMKVVFLQCSCRWKYMEVWFL